MRTWLPLMPSTVTWTSSPMFSVSPMRLVRISIFPYSLSRLHAPHSLVPYPDDYPRLPAPGDSRPSAWPTPSADKFTMPNPGLNASPFCPWALYGALNPCCTRQYTPIFAGFCPTLMQLLCQLSLTRGGLFIQSKRAVQRAHRQFQVFLVHHHRNLNLGGGDHLDVNALAGQGLEHLAGDAGVRTHAHAHDRNLDDLVVARDPARFQVLSNLSQDIERLFVIAPMHGEGKVGGAVGANILHNHVDIDMRLADVAKNLRGDAGPVRHPLNRQLGLVAVERDT